MMITRNHILLLAGAMLLLIAADWKTGRQSLHSAPIEGGIQRLELASGNYYFRPSVLKVIVDVPVELVVWQEQGFLAHNLVLQSPEGGFNIEEELTAEPKVIRFTPRRPGNYSFYCSGGLIEGHREKGMQGVLKVGTGD